ncbi:hypothetical protein [Nocardia otitidiscaviarum]|uniref:hypothetical protein n=1 Tax=Nocardia otitidiscaviarum TaxID=1823 RepID=UPI002453C583|nr:hypothetical protein [Nocardia otitidiscaviarum]
MGRISAVGYLIALTASVLAGCAESDTAQPVSERSGVAEVRQPRTVSRAPEPDGPPACGDLGVPADSPDCRLRSRDPVGLAFTVRRTTVDGRTDATIEVTGPDGAATQTLAERDIRHPSDPSLRDIDGDGREELIVPLHLATPNTRYAVYHASGAAIELRRAGELTGVAIDTTEDGYVASTARDAQLSWSVGFWRFADDVLTPVVTARVRLDTDGTRVTDGTCTVVDEGGLSDTELPSLVEARERFCAELVVLRILRG